MSIYCVTDQMRNESIGSITVPILLSVGIHQVSKLDWIEKEGETLHIVLWYNKHYWSGEVERKYIILF